MKPSYAANLSLALVTIGWISLFYGAQPLFIIFVPQQTHVADIRAHDPFLFAGLFELQASLWFSGYAFALAPWRASIALLACVLPTIIILWHIATTII